MMMTYRSNHMPMLMKIEVTHIQATFVRHHLNQSGSGDSTLQLIMIQVDVQW